MSKLVLIRGLPGSGKSTLARKRYVSQGYRHFEADMYFMRGDGRYDFRPEILREAHDWCQRETEIALRNGHNVVVSNTFTQLWEMEPYFLMPCFDGCHVIKCIGDYGSIHDVPAFAVKKMRDRWQDYQGEMIL